MIMKKIFAVVFVAGLLLSCSLEVPTEITQEFSTLPEVVDFNYHVKPILSDRCYQCHGPDEKTRKAGLRLDVESIAFSKLESGKRAFSPGSLYKSEGARRILHDDPDLLMPPPEANLSLTNREKAVIFKWIEQGAEWKEHWAFLPPQNKKSITKDKSFHNPIDGFIKNRLEQEGLDFSPKASKAILARRLFLDLTGLPPSIEELDNFLNDKSDKAYESLVDRLLSTDAYAERLTLDWLDLSRYADSHGLHADGVRTMWPWRDWVLKAFKENMPYDQFVTWQLAGDLLPEATQEQKLATAFNRNSPMTAEGGVIDEEWRLHYVFDRTETLSTAFLGLTVACAKCHDHKFDPISQKDYFQLTAFFNSIRELGMTGDDGDFGPLLALTDHETQAKLDQLNEGLTKIKKDIAITSENLQEIYQYSEELASKTKAKPELVLHGAFEKMAKIKKGRHSVDGNKDFYGGVDQMPEIVPGVKGNSFQFSQDYDHLNITDKIIPSLEWTDPFSLSIWMSTDKRKKGQSQTLMANTGEKNSLWRGWEYYLDDQNRVNLRLINVAPSNLIHVRSVDSLKLNIWHHLTLTVDGSGKTEGVKLYRNGKEIQTEGVIDNLYKTIKPTRPDIEKGFVERKRDVIIGRSYSGFLGDYGLFLGKLDELKFFNGVLTPFEVQSIYSENSKQKEVIKWPMVQKHLIEKDPKILQLKKQLKENREEYLEIYAPINEIMVMREMEEPRPTYLYNRGNYNEPLYTVEAKVPEILPSMDEKFPKNRLGLSQWLFDPKNPLTARVAVNRYWQMIFGKGLVATPDDFGVQGQLPSHPELLDWLAISFSENWDVKALIKKMVLSQTYQQQSVSNPTLDQKDPENLLLARANAARLPAEIIRDNALKISGLLNPKIGGESVLPYQPKGLWKEKSNFSAFLLEYKESQGEDLYRRGLYTFIRRTSPPPNMVTFDATSREVCTVKREVTSTPLQALVLLNDPQFFEASRVFAERIINSKNTLEEQISHGFRLATARHPRENELEILVDLYNSQYQYFRQNRDKAYRVISVGEKPRDKSINIAKTAAMTMVANTLLNHDETYTKR
ncbi:MAG: DUF1553 domain-containing protein [Flavobacteriaceae bacterium TMED42]|nr:MAG: DUF1553 domain-containing protein [Flavobacteriaceae bacterium TMED42]|tara:strand:+ start:1435 stop:4659 length:3225 start_codon:yes stop_codon:yes gene_type:complete